MIRFKQYFRETTRDTEGMPIFDTGGKGKQWEDTFIRACKMIGLDLKVNRGSGALWDLHAAGPGWTKVLGGRDINIKLARTKWMMSSSELVKMLPWQGFEGEFDNDKAAAKVKKFLNKRGMKQIVWMKPKSTAIEKAIKDALAAQDVNKLDELLVKNNFNHERLGNKYSVRVLDNGKRVTSVAIDFGGKVFMRSEKPRDINKTATVTFRTPTAKLSKSDRKVKQKKGLPE